MNKDMVKYNAKTSVSRAYKVLEDKSNHSIVAEKEAIYWTTGMTRVDTIRKGVPYSTIESLGKRLNKPVKDLLEIFDIPQTTYNKRKKDLAVMGSRDTELVLLITELLDFGFEVFNQETEKFLRWLNKPNISLAGYTPESLLDSGSGIQEVKNALNRIEYGSLA
jgi:putative toxin-antitoxin system antitoxin component (TIGR02293 family)